MSAHSRQSGAVVCVLLAGLLATAGAAAGAAPDLDEWITGPVRYIARKAEMKQFRQLGNDSDRALFIQKFWHRRDPTPETLTNEYRQMFWERVRQANDSFVDAGIPGWRTDRGKVHILYGPPTDIQEELHLDPTTGEAPRGAGRGVLRWIYEGRPAGRRDMDPIVVVPFVRDASGRFRLSYDPVLASVFWDPLALREGRARAFDDLIGTPRRSELSVMLDLGRMQEVPPQEQVLLEQVETIESYRTQPLRATVARLRHPDRDGALVVVTADVTEITPGTRPAVIARFRTEDAAEHPRMLGEGSFRVESVNGRRLAQGRIVLDPGPYDLTLMVADPQTAGTGMFRARLQAPATPGFRLSDVIVAETVEPLEFASLASHDEPYYVGPYRVIPRLDSRVRRGDALRLVYEVYGGSPPYRLAYGLEGREQDGNWTALGRPSTGASEATTQAWELPTASHWPTGAYRVRIDVEDTDDRLVSVHVPFEVYDEAPDDIAEAP